MSLMTNRVGLKLLQNLNKIMVDMDMDMDMGDQCNVT